MRESFAMPAGVAIVIGLVAGLGLPVIDRAFDIVLPVIQFATQEGTRSLLATIATATLSVAGLSFSVTVTAVTLASNQLSPRVLRTFRTDRLSQMTLAALLGTSIYCIALLVRLGARPLEAAVPNLSTTVAVLLVVASFLLFAVFIAHIVHMLQPASIVASIARDARGLLERPYPSDVGKPAGGDVRGRALRRMEAGPGSVVRAEEEGYLTSVSGEPLLAAMKKADGVAAQRADLGDYILPGDELAVIWSAMPPDEDLVGRVRAAFVLGTQRSPVQDLAFPVRQLADIALKGVSPGINDPTTAEAAMDAMAATLVRFTHSAPVELVRLDEDGEPRLVSRAPDLDDLVRLGFEQVRVFAADDPVVTRRLLGLLEAIAAAAGRHGHCGGELERQAGLVREAMQGASA